MVWSRDLIHMVQHRDLRPCDLAQNSANVSYVCTHTHLHFTSITYMLWGAWIVFQKYIINVTATIKKSMHCHWSLTVIFLLTPELGAAIPAELWVWCVGHTLSTLRILPLPSNTSRAFLEWCAQTCSRCDEAMTLRLA